VTVTLLYRDGHDLDKPMAMTPAERQRKRREKLKLENLKSILVRGEKGEFDERIRIAIAVQNMAREGRLDDQVIESIIDEAVRSFPAQDKIKRTYIKKILTAFLEPTGN
jgi:hypothetical protein